MVKNTASLNMTVLIPNLYIMRCVLKELQFLIMHSYLEVWAEVIKLFSCSTQLSTKFQQLIKTKIPTNKDVSCFKSLRYCIYHANKC